MTALEALKEFLHIEQDYNLYDFEIGSVKLWNLYRTPYRYRYVSKRTGVKSISNIVSKKEIAKYLIKNTFVSFIKISSLFLKHRKYANVIIPHGRLQISNGTYFDKFTDPVIDQSELSKSCCILHKPYAIDDYSNRRHNEMVVPMNFLYLISYLLVPFLIIPHILSGNIFILLKMYKVASPIVPLKRRDFIAMNVGYLSFRFMTKTYSLLFHFLGVKRVFGVARLFFMDATLAAHHNGISVYEFQHGVTHGETEYYSGPQCSVLDPDYFLAFGEMWNGNQFGIDPAKIINVGWAYKNEMSVNENKLIPDSVLFISSPEISFNILNTAKGLSEKYPQYHFYIRCHPYEKYSEKQMMEVNNSINLFLDDNSIDSQIALCRYQYIIGENSSVVYEALSFGKRVGRLCYNGINSTRFSDQQDDGFIYLYNDEDFIKFVNPDDKPIDNKAYSDFKPDIINSLLNN